MIVLNFCRLKGYFSDEHVKVVDLPEFENLRFRGAPPFDENAKN